MPSIDVFTGPFYAHLPPDEGATFVAEARCVASELILVVTARPVDRQIDGWDNRTYLGFGEPRRRRDISARTPPFHQPHGYANFGGPWCTVVASRPSRESQHSPASYPGR